MVLHYNNQFDNSTRAYNYSKEYNFQEDYIVGFGFFSFLEIQGRLSESPGYHRDLSANVKFQLPYHHKYLPNIAIGIQDLGGAANNYDNQYIVLDKEYKFFRSAIGYGHATTKNSSNARMDGVFGSLEIQATPWLYIMGENDTRENHVGMRLEMPNSWSENFNLQATLAYNITESQTSFGINLNIPLIHNSMKHSKTFVKQKTAKIIKEEKKYLDLQNENLSKNKEQYSNDLLIDNYSKIDSPSKLVNRLAIFGFENIRVAQQNDILYLEVENTIFDHTDLDAIGYILGVLVTSDIDSKKYVLTLLKNNIQTITISGNIKDFKNYLSNSSLENTRVLKSHLKFSRNFDTKDIAYSKLKNSSFFIPRVEFSLGITSTIGTEYGVYDYIAALRTNIYMTLYDGLVASVMYEMPFANSSDFDSGGVYYIENKLNNRIVNAMLHQTIHLDNFLNTISFGKYKTDYIGVLDQANYTTTDGQHAIKFTGGYFSNTNDRTLIDKEIYLASYRYNYAPMDLYLEVTYGKYWYGDRGARVELKRFFGETSIALYYKNTRADYSNAPSATEEIAGATISFPFTARKLYKANYFQIKGKRDWQYSVSSTINRDDGTNSLNGNFGIIPTTDLKLTTEYLNRDRLSSDYILNHLDRLRDAYIEYSK